jgi:hypothetical protein
MNTKRSPVSNQNKMFRSIVLMGSGLAFGCGGVAKVEGGGAGGSSAASHGGTTGASSSAGSGVVTGAAGTLVFGSGGTTGQAGGSNVGGSISVGFGGSGPITGNGGTAGVSSLPCPPSQWACAGQETDCQLQNSIALPTSNCKCDGSRPAQASNCKPGQSFVCLSANRDASGQGIYPPIPFECSCQATTSDCASACDATFGNGALNCYFDDVNSILCDCYAPVVLK